MVVGDRPTGRTTPFDGVDGCSNRPPRAWYMDEEFEAWMPPVLSSELARFYGMGWIGRDYAQAFAAFLDVPACRQVMREALDQWDT